jgi:hypothetical protein
MSARILPRNTWRVALGIATGALLLAGMPAQVTLAQQHDANNPDAAAHAAPTGENKGGRFQAPQLKMAPAKERPIIHGGANVTDHNAIGISIVRPDRGQQPTGLNLGRAATLAPPVAPVSPVPPGAAVGLGSRALAALHMPAPAPRPLVLSRGTINGAAFTRPGTALVPLGGPAKQAAIGINGTNIQPKH